MGQGYYYGKPVDAAATQLYLQKHFSDAARERS